MFRRRASAFTICSSILITFAAVGQADEPPAEKVKESVESVIEQALDNKTVTLDVEDLPLEKVVRILGKQAKLRVALDRKALDELGVGVDSPVTIRVMDISLRSALRTLLRRIDPGLTYTIRDEALLITSHEAAKENLLTRVYDVRDLMTTEEAHIFEDGFPLDKEDAQKQRITLHDPDELIEIITRSIAPESWDEVGGPGSIADLDTTLVVSQVLPAHTQIEGLLKALRAVRIGDAQDHDITPVRVCSAAESDAVKRIRAALDKPVDFDLHHDTLQDAVDLVQDVTEVPILLDERALDELGIVSDTPVEASFGKRTLGAALRHTLQQIDSELTLAINNEVVMITTREAAEENLITIVYPVLDLVIDDPDHKWHPHMLDFDSVIEMIEHTVEPDDWDETGGAGTIIESTLCSALIISQTQDNHDKVAALLTKPRARRPKAQARPQPFGGPKPDGQAANKDEKKTDDYIVAVYHLDEWDRAEKHVPVRSLVKVIEEMIEPDSWQSEGTMIRVLPNRLVIRQTKEVHQKIYDLLLNMNVLMEDVGFEGAANNRSAVSASSC